MKKKLSDTFIQCKGVITIAIEEEIKNKDKITFNPSITVFGTRDSEELYINFTELEFDAEESTWYAHNYVTNEDLSTDEYWTPLRDLSFDELYKIAERL